MSHYNPPTSSQRQGWRNTSDRRGSSRNAVTNVPSTNRRYSTSRITSDTGADISEITSSLRTLNLGRQTSVQWPPGQASQASSRTIPRAVPIVSRPTRIAISEKDIEDYVQRIIDSITPSQQELAAKKEMSVHLETIVRRVLPHAKLRIMGGVTNTFALRNSDVDICFDDTESRFLDFSVWNLNKLTDEFRRAGYHPELLLHTYIPLIKLNVDWSGWSNSIQVDISWSNSIGIYKTALLRAYSNVDRRVRPLILFVKHWSKTRKVADTRRGGMGSFAWCLLCIYFLMKVVKPPIVPNLQSMATERKYFQGCDISFATDMKDWSTNTKLIGTLIKDFFNFANSFDFANQVVSVRSVNEYLTKSAKGWTPDLVRSFGRSGQKVYHSYYMAIEDPFELGSNAGRTVKSSGLQEQLTVLWQIKSELGRAVSILNGTNIQDYGLSKLCEERLSYY